MNGQHIKDRIFNVLISASRRMAVQYSHNNVARYVYSISRCSSGLPRCRAESVHDITYNSVVKNISNTIRTCALTHDIPETEAALQKFKDRYTTKDHMLASFNNMYKIMPAYSNYNGEILQNKYNLRSHYPPEVLCHKYLFSHNNLKEDLLSIFNELSL